MLYYQIPAKEYEKNKTLIFSFIEKIKEQQNQICEQQKQINKLKEEIKKQDDEVLNRVAIYFRSRK